MPRISYIIKREKKLVEKSSIADLPEYAGLVAVLGRYDIVNAKVLEDDSSIDEQTRYTIIHTWSAIVLNASTEWQFYNFVEKKSKCMLDNMDIKTEYYIKNQINGNQLAVGSECIKHFGFENGFSEGITSKSFIAKQQREQRRINRREGITKLYGNIDRQIDAYYSQIYDSHVTLNSEILHTAKQKIDTLKTYYENYVDSKESDATIYPKLKQDIDDYLDSVVSPWVKQQESELFACTLEDVKHLEANGHVDIVAQIRDNDGLIDAETVVYLYHANFIKKHLQTFKEKLAPCFRVLNLTASGLSVGFESDAIVGIDYSVPLKSFLEMFGGVLFGKPVALTFRDYYPICNFVDTSRNRWELIESLYHFFRKSEYDFLYDEEKYSFILVAQSGKYCDRLTMQSLVGIIIPRIAMGHSVESMDGTFFSRLTWTMMDSLSKVNADDIRKDLKRLRKLREESIETIR